MLFSGNKSHELVTSQRTQFPMRSQQHQLSHSTGHHNDIQQHMAKLFENAQLALRENAPKPANSRRIAS